MHFEGCQIKSKEKFRLFCQLLDTLEKEIGIHEVEISLKDIFICPDIDLTEFSNSDVPMEKIIGGLAIRLHNQRYGKESKYKKLKA